MNFLKKIFSSSKNRQLKTKLDSEKCELDIANLSSNAIDKTVRIGYQVWMKENLNTTTFQNGDLITEAKSIIEFSEASKDGTPVWCYYNFDPENEKKYGKMYNWFAVSDLRGLAPKGFHVPNEKDWNMLPVRPGVNISEFSDLQGGMFSIGGGFMAKSQFCAMWSSDEANKKQAWMRLSSSPCEDYKSMADKEVGLYVRCIKDRSSNDDDTASFAAPNWVFF